MMKNPSISSGAQQAFTLIELLVVITMVTLVVGIVVIDFRGAGARQDVQLMAEETVALLQQSHVEVQAGAIEDGSWMCRGVYFESGEAPQRAAAAFSVAAGSCDWDALVLEDYGPGRSSSVQELFPSANLYVMFVPPDGELLLYDGSGVSASDVEVLLGSDATDIQRKVVVSAMTGQADITPVEDEE